MRSGRTVVGSGLEFISEPLPQYNFSHTERVESWAADCTTQANTQQNIAFERGNLEIADNPIYQGPNTIHQDIYDYDNHTKLNLVSSEVYDNGCCSICKALQCHTCFSCAIRIAKAKEQYDTPDFDLEDYSYLKSHSNQLLNCQSDSYLTERRASFNYLPYPVKKEELVFSPKLKCHLHNRNIHRLLLGRKGYQRRKYINNKVETRKRLSRSLDDLPGDIRQHILKCQCSCDHLGYGNFSSLSLERLSTKPFERSSSLKPFNWGRQQDGNSCQQRAEMDLRRHLILALCLVVILAGVAGVGITLPLALKADTSADNEKRLQAAKALLSDTPLIDGHNDLPWNIRKFMHNRLHSFNMTSDLSNTRPWSRSSWSHTDLPRLRKGHVSAQFWVSYVPCKAQFLNAVQLTIEQIDLIKRLIVQYSEDLHFAKTAEDVEMAFKKGKIASFIGVEGGHAIQNSLGVLRSLHELGVRYMTLTHTCSTPWAESARNKETDQKDPSSPSGLTSFGKIVVMEMNRLGILVDLSHVSQATMRAALQTSKAPILFSHSCVYELCKNPRNVPDDILRKVGQNGGLVMVSFYNYFLTCSEEANVRDVIHHINHVRKTAGIDHVGIGADFDGINRLPKGLEDVSKYPNLFAELLRDPLWSNEDLKKLAGLNLVRVMKKVEEVAMDLKNQELTPHEETVPFNSLRGKDRCSLRFLSNERS